MIPPFVDEVRRARGLMTLAEIADLVARGNVVFDPFSTLIAATARIGTGNVFHPCVTLEVSPEAELVIGDDNLFHPTTVIGAATGPIRIGSANQFGEGGFTARANRPGATIVIGDGGRYLGGAAVHGASRLGSGSQFLGAITAEGCELEGGESHRHPDPDRRGGLLKGSGVARDLRVRVGHVIVGSGRFRAEDHEPQRNHHPKG
jgi:hypothetical protein